MMLGQKLVTYFILKGFCLVHHISHSGFSCKSILPSLVNFIHWKLFNKLKMGFVNGNVIF